jgi:autotransporter-associated beta strand protein
MKWIAASAFAMFLLMAAVLLSVRTGRQKMSTPGLVRAAVGRLSPEEPVDRGVHSPGTASDEAWQIPTRSQHSSGRRQRWEPNFFTLLRHSDEGDSIELPLIDREIAVGDLHHIDRKNGEVIYVSGLLSSPAGGRFFFQKQTEAGVAGEFVGLIEIPSAAKAYRIEPAAAGGGVDLVEHPLHTVVCLDFARPGATPAHNVEQITQADSGAGPASSTSKPQEHIVMLESLAQSTAVIYLDFQGGYTPTWTGITYERPNLDEWEIREIWERVAEDFAPFNINVTTDLRVYQRAPESSRQRVIITPTDTVSPGGGGAAYQGSFNWTGDTPCWVFVTSSPKHCADACSHEAGHTLGLSHLGRVVNGSHSEYYDGHGVGDTGWAPIMGRGYSKNVTQWSKGEYIDANNLQDQLAIITAQNNVRYRADDTGDTPATSRHLELFDDYTANTAGIIEKTGDADRFEFSTHGGPVFLRADPLTISPNLGLAVSLHDFHGNLIASNSPQDTLWASISANLAPGSYNFRVAGEGRNNPLTNGFSTYASLGRYSITGSVANARLPNRFVIPENTPDGTEIGLVPAHNASGDPLTYTILDANGPVTIRAGNSGALNGGSTIQFIGNLKDAFVIDNLGRLRVANRAWLDYESVANDPRLPGQIEIFVDILNLRDATRSEFKRRVIIEVTDQNEPPALLAFSNLSTVSPALPPTGLGGFRLLLPCLDTNCQFTASVLERSPRGTPVGKAIGYDPDAGSSISYGLVGGNTDGLFSIDSVSGLVTVAGELIAAKQNIYNLLLAVSDQKRPEPLVTTSSVIINVELPFSRGAIACAVYTNITGSAISDLTNQSSFPHNPAWETHPWQFDSTATLRISGFLPTLQTEKSPSEFEASTNSPPNSGTVMRGYLLPPITGHYSFWIASRHHGELWLSTSTNAAHITSIAHITGEGTGTEPREWEKYPSQQSSPIMLMSGHAYYIEARMKTGTQDGHLSIAWECAENGISRDVIPGKYLAPYSMNYRPHPLGFNARVREDIVTGARVGTVAVADINKSDTLFITISKGNEAGLFALDATTGIIRIADSSALAGIGQTNFTLEVKAADNGTPPLTGSGNVTINVIAPDRIATPYVQQEIWTNMNGVALADLTSQPKFPERPDAMRPLSSFDSNAGFGSNYASRIQAYLTPTNTGAYTFFIASDDQSQLKFSFSTNPAQAYEIASVATSTGYREWTRFAAQKSGFMWLVAGQRYYLETLHRQSGGPDHIEVAWAGPGLSGTNIIGGSVLTPVDLNYPPQASDASVRLSITATNGAIVTRVAAVDGPADKLAYRIVSGNPGNAFAIDPDTGVVAVADSTLLANYAGTHLNVMVQVQDSGYGGFYPLKSAQAKISIQIVDDTPAVLWTGAGSDGKWSTRSNWDTATLTDNSRITFGGSNSGTNYNDLLLGAGLITMNGGFIIRGNPLLLSGGLVSFGDNTWSINSALKSKQTFRNGWRTFIVAGSINNNGHDLTLHTESALRLDGVLSGAGGLIKTGAGRLIITSNNTYTGPTVIQFGVLALTNSGAMARTASVEVQSSAVLDGRGSGGGIIIPAGQTLKGSGTILGPATIEGTLAQHPANTAGFLTFSNNLVLAGHTIVRLSQPAPVQFPMSPFPTFIFSWGGNNALRITGSLHCGGGLAVTNVSQPLGTGAEFKLFNAARITGSFATTNLPSLSPGLEWDTSRLGIDATIRVVAGRPKIQVVSHTSSVLTIRLQIAQNLNYVIESSLSLEPASVWLPVATRRGTSIISIPLPIDAAEAQRFYRVRVF